jgi:FtsH-binding integral membrane protein
MSVALVISASVAYLFDTSAAFQELVFSPTGGLSGFGYFAIFSPLVFSLVMQIGYNRISYPVLALLFVVYSSLIGISLGLICGQYTGGSVASVFISSAVLFGVMAAAGYYTHQDLTKFGTIMYIAFIALFISFGINYFIHSAQFDYILSLAGVVIFTGLTAYYMQLLKRIGAGIEYGTATQKKLSLIGGLVLYITLINLFLMLLRLFGRRR